MEHGSRDPPRARISMHFDRIHFPRIKYHPLKEELSDGGKKEDFSVRYNSSKYASVQNGNYEEMLIAFNLHLTGNYFEILHEEAISRGYN